MSQGTDSATADFIRSHLDLDLEEVAQQAGQSSLRPSLAPFLTHDGLFNPAALTTATATAGSCATFVLQVMSIKDVSLSREQRSRAMIRAIDGSTGATSSSVADEPAADDAAAMVDATLQAMEDQNEEAQQQNAPLRPSGGHWRCLRLELSDGFQRVLAVEDNSARARQQYGTMLAPDGLVLGSKVVVRIPFTSATTGATAFSAGGAAVQHGILRVHAGNTQVLGGRVRALEVFWEAQARQQLAASTGRPSRQPAAVAAPPQQPPHVSTAPQLNNNNNSNSTASVSNGTLHQFVNTPQNHSPPPPSPSPAQPVVQPLRQWPTHVAQTRPQTPFVTVAFITEVVSDMVINEATTADSSTVFTYALLAQLSSPDAVVRETQQQQQGSGGGDRASPAAEVLEDDHLTVDLGHAWLRQLVGMPAEDFRALSLSTAAADVARLTATVEAVGQALEQFGKGRFTLVQRPGDGIVEVVKAEPEL